MAHRLIFFPLFLFMLGQLSAQGLRNRCPNGPMDSFLFSQQKQFVSTRQGVSAMLEAAKSLSGSQCLSSLQVKEIAALFPNDYDRLEYAQFAWSSVYDKDEFYVVMDAFMQASSLFRLYDFIRRENATNTTKPNPPAPQAIQYPDAAVYAGAMGCSPVQNDPGFQQVLQGVTSQPNDQARMNYLKGLWNLNCFSVAQMMLIGTEFQQEPSRLQFLKNASSRVYDSGNLNYAVQILSSLEARKDWNTFLATRTNNVNSSPNPSPDPTNAACQVTQDALNRIIQSLGQQSVNSSRVNLAKQQIQVNKCFTARQVKSIVATISVESGRLEVMKFAYDYTIDKPEYLNILDVLSVQSSRDEIMKLVR